MSDVPTDAETEAEKEWRECVMRNGTSTGAQTMGLLHHYFIEGWEARSLSPAVRAAESESLRSDIAQVLELGQADPALYTEEQRLLRSAYWALAAVPATVDREALGSEIEMQLRKSMKGLSALSARFAAQDVIAAIRRSGVLRESAEVIANARLEGLEEAAVIAEQAHVDTGDDICLWIADQIRAAIYREDGTP